MSIKTLFAPLKQKETRRFTVIAIVLGLLFGYMFFSPSSMNHTQMSDKDPHAGHAHNANIEEKNTTWTCSMHPQIQKDKPGQCPICGMDLIPVESAVSDDEEGVRLEMSPAAVKLAEIETTPVVRKSVEAEVRLNGTINYDETRLAYVTAWIGGRLDRLYVDYTGVTVKKGEHMVYLYSPEVISAQEELLQAIANNASAETIDAARERLRLWGLTKPQIATIEERKTVRDHITVTSPTSGIVIEKHVNEGQYVKTGTRIYSLADLSMVWVELDAYESDLTWVRYGQAVEFTAAAYPGEIFHGRISFIDPVLNMTKRTVKLRVNAQNEEGKLKPGMFVRAIIRAKVSNRGPVANEDLKGKWIGPMHPEIVKDGPGKCDICKMPLVPIEQMGFISDPEKEDLPLVIPATAPLITGKRAIAYVRVPGTERPTFEAREVMLGARAGKFYLVKMGLAEGDEVVTHGNFKIDSALQIQAKPSMMNPEGGGSTGGHNH